MNQDKIFWDKEGDQWFERNRSALANADKIDWPTFLIEKLQMQFESVVELGCSNGWRLQKLATKYKLAFENIRGVEASEKAIEDAKVRYPLLKIERALLSNVPVQEVFDLVIVNYVLHWVDRASLSKAISEIDRLVRDGGILIIGDFMPDHPEKRKYHHLPDKDVFTFKQNYAEIFKSLGVYREVESLVYDHDKATYELSDASHDSRGACVALKKSLHSYYIEAK